MQRYGAQPDAAIAHASKLMEGNLLRIRDGDRDVLALEFVDGKLRVAAATLPLIIEKLADEFEQGAARSFHYAI